MNESYYPSNGTEGVGFISKWCENCKRDPASRNINAKTSCEILFRSVIGDTPKQWIWKEGGPVCTSFIDFRDRTIHRKRKIKGQTELFKEEEQK